MNWKAISLHVCAILLLGLAVHVYERTHEPQRAEFFEKNLMALRAKSMVPMHNPPTERDIIAMAGKDTAKFCHSTEGFADGCELDAVLMDDQWMVFAWPYGPHGECCAPDSDHFFYYSRAGVFLREEKGGP